MDNFSHFRVKSEYSLTNSIVRIDALVNSALERNINAIALTDNSNLFGLVKFYTASIKNGIKPIIGADIYIKYENRIATGLFIVKNNLGYKQLSSLISKAYSENYQGNKPIINFEWLNLGTSSGLIFINGGTQTLLSEYIQSHEKNDSNVLIDKFLKVFDDRFYLEIMRIDSNQSLHNSIFEIAHKKGIPLIATHPIYFLNKEDFDSHEIKVCISSGRKVNDPHKENKYFKEHYLKSSEEMHQVFSDLPELIQNTNELAKRCNFYLKTGKINLPTYATPNKKDINTYLTEQAQLGLKSKLDKITTEKHKTYLDRLDYELKIIIQMGYSGYFVIVADFIQWSKKNNIPVGPGRGSGAGSLVAYSLGITDLDPIRYGLIFERFLNPERISMPDFDIDFCQHGRDKVIDYVKKKYGADSVSQIITFGTMAARAVVRDVGRVLDWPYTKVDEIAKLIPFIPGRQIKLDDAVKEDDILSKRIDSEEETKELFMYAKKLEGLTRNAGIHAGGVLIAPGRIEDFCPLFRSGLNEPLTSQLDKDDVEKIGLVKFDFLGLTTLTILDQTTKLININRKEKVQLGEISLADKSTYETFSKANTIGVFQFESPGMRDLLKKSRPNKFEDIIALVALYRPGPMDLIPDYVARKNGKPYDYPDSRVEKILSETYGIMVYQEQVMQIAQVLADYSLGGADILRRAMGKKKPKEMAEQREKFLNGAINNGITKVKANSLFDMIEKFAGYGFNKSHAAAYALISYQTAYFKTHFPLEFYVANLNLALDNTDRLRDIISDAKKSKIKIILPDINKCLHNFTVDRTTDSIQYGLGAIKGTGESAIENIVKNRKDAPFISIMDFCQRVDRRIVNKRSIESLIKSGAFDSLNINKIETIKNIEKILQEAEKKENLKNQANLFSDKNEMENILNGEKFVDFEVEEKLFFEKESLGFYLTKHPFSIYSEIINKLGFKKISDVQSPNENLTLSGIISNIRQQNSKRGKMAIIRLEDSNGQINIPIFSEKYIEFRKYIKEDNFVIVTGKTVKDRNEGLRIDVESISNIDETLNKYCKYLRLQVDNKNMLREILNTSIRGNVPIIVKYKNEEAECSIKLDKVWNIFLEKTFIDNVNSKYGKKIVEMNF
jgi:DNA polymerase-3 subunit alpha